MPGRMQRVSLSPPGPAVFVDFAHTPQAVTAVLNALAGARRVVVLGCGGDRDPHKREPMGAAAVAGAEVVVVTDDNPRSEDPAAIRAEILRGAHAEQLAQRRRHGREVAVVDGGDRRSAIELGMTRTGRADVLAVLGKGHETGQEVAGRILPFDDVDVVQTAWAELSAQRPRARTVIAVSVAEVADLLGAEIQSGSAVPNSAAMNAATISGLVVDSRRIAPGSLFVALPGEHADGHDFVAQAFAAGAVAALIARPVPDAAGPCLLTDDPLVALGRIARNQVDRGRHGRPAGRGHHGLPRQDLDQGPARAGAGERRTDRRSVRQLQQRGRSAAHRRPARAPTPASWSPRWAPAASGTSPISARSPRPRWVSCSTSVPPTSASSVRSTPSPPPRANWSRRYPRPESPCSTPTTLVPGAMQTRTRAQLVGYSVTGRPSRRLDVGALGQRRPPRSRGLLSLPGPQQPGI